MDKSENQLNNYSHGISIIERKSIIVTGVKKIESLNSEEFIINTLLGILIVKGSNLEMQQLDIDKGLLWINGTIDSMNYTNVEKKKEKNNFFGKVFK